MRRVLDERVGVLVPAEDDALGLTVVEVDVSSAARPSVGSETITDDASE